MMNIHKELPLSFPGCPPSPDPSPPFTQISRHYLRDLGVSEQTYYRWRREYGGMKTSQAKRLKELEKENQRLKRAGADLTVDNMILKEASKGNF